MAKYKLDEKMVYEMSNGDKATLLSLYLHRCLTPSLIINHLYNCDGFPPEIAGHHLDAMILDKLIEVIPYGEREDALFLTPYGVKTVVSLYGDRLKKVYKSGIKSGKLPTYWDLKMCTTNINHQMHLNQFGLEFEDYACDLIEYAYYDGKFMSPASEFLMPDGMIALPNRLLFLEMDMGTEDAKRLTQKWNSYRIFLNSPKAYYENQHITMFFILDGIAKVQLRQKTTMRSLMEYLGCRNNGNFEAYFETPGKCHEIIKTKYLSAASELSADEYAVLTDLRRFRFRISSPSFLKEIGLHNTYYIKRLGEDGKLNFVGNRPQEFIVDLWMDRRFSVFQRIVSHKQIEARIRKLANREVSYLLIVPSITWVNKIPLVTKSSIPEGLFFSTPERLRNTFNWYEALFQIDQLKNLYHFQDDSLRVPVHEKRLIKS